MVNDGNAFENEFWRVCVVNYCFFSLSVKNGDVFMFHIKYGVVIFLLTHQGALSKKENDKEQKRNIC